MNNAWPQLATQLRKLSETVQKGIHQRARVDSSARMHNHPRGLIDRDHILVFIQHFQRDLLRCREDIRADLLRARHRLSKFLLRHDRRFTATKKAWSKRHDAWLRAQTWSLPALDQTHRAYLRTVDEAVARLQAVEQDLRARLDLEPLRPRVQRLRCADQ